jgi:hypothetical protein
LVFREKINSNLDGEWELGAFETIVRSLREIDQASKRARGIMRWIVEELTEAQQRHSWPGHMMGEWLDDSTGDSPEDNWGLAKRAIEKLLKLKLIEGAASSGFRLTGDTGHPFIVWAADKHCFE